MSCLAGRIPALASLFFATALSAFPQQQTPPVPAAGAVPSIGLESPEEARNIVNASLAEIDALKPVLAAIHPEVWSQQKGAPGTYMVQWQTAQREVDYVDTVGRQFLRQLESLSVALDLYYRMEALEATVRSVNEGAQRYGDATSAGKLSAFVGKSFDRRQRFRDYIRDLATNLEQNYKVADEEAQRCRAIISREPPATSKVKKPK
jgi:hypothetical protein